MFDEDLEELDSIHLIGSLWLTLYHANERYVIVFESEWDSRSMYSFKSGEIAKDYFNRLKASAEYGERK